MTRAIYPGSFDPVTFGHLDVIARGLRLFDEVIVAAAPSEGKNPLFSIDERLDLIRASLPDEPRLKVKELNGLLVDFVESENARVIIRGLRAISDFEFEFQMALMNRRLAPAVETIFLMPKEDYSYISSRIVKEVARLGGDVAGVVPAPVREALERRFAGGGGTA
ncbi:MAG: pantetheine-phosphate adenylyltransferase [Chthoniobacterales bacterium]|jgi:pantetheine-phosphate adenylyltransferase